MINLKLFIIFLILFTYSKSVEACTAFCLSKNGQVVVGKSYDWYWGHGHGALYTSPRGTPRTALALNSTLPQPATWTSRYGNLMFTQFGRALPISGMNERGLVVELLQLDETIYNSDFIEKPYVNESQWAQYQLDQFASVKEVLTHINELRVVGLYTGIHYFLADATGAAATVEFLNGHIIVRSGTELPVTALTNTIYDEALKSSEPTEKLNLAIGRGRTSQVRFKTVRQALTQLEAVTDFSQYAWKILDDVRLDGWAMDALFEPTQWNIVYNPVELKIQFRTRTSNSLKTIQFSDLNFKPGSEEMMLDMNLPVTGDMSTYLHPYSFTENSQLLWKNKWLFILSGQRKNIDKVIGYGHRTGKDSFKK